MTISGPSVCAFSFLFNNIAGKKEEGNILLHTKAIGLKLKASPLSFRRGKRKEIRFAGRDLWKCYFANPQWGNEGRGWGRAVYAWDASLSWVKYHAPFLAIPLLLLAHMKIHPLPSADSSLYPAPKISISNPIYANIFIFSNQTYSYSYSLSQSK